MPGRPDVNATVTPVTVVTHVQITMPVAEARVLTEVLRDARDAPGSITTEFCDRLQLRIGAALEDA
jgi:hypothetical protein